VIVQDADLRLPCASAVCTHGGSKTGTGRQAHGTSDTSGSAKGDGLMGHAPKGRLVGDDIALRGRAVRGVAAVGDANADPVEVGERVQLSGVTKKVQRERMQAAVDGERGGRCGRDLDLVAVIGQRAKGLVVNGH
jgi:hypothetical protein